MDEVRRFVPEAMCDSDSGTLVSQRSFDMNKGLNSGMMSGVPLSCRKPWFAARFVLMSG